LRRRSQRSGGLAASCARVSAGADALCNKLTPPSLVALGDASAACVQDDFAALVHAVKEGRVLYDNLKKTIAYTMAHIAPEIVAVAISILLGMPLGLGALLTLTIDLLTEQVQLPACWLRLAWIMCLSPAACGCEVIAAHARSCHSLPSIRKRPEKQGQPLHYVYRYSVVGVREWSAS
jgi:hypothetical protein